MAKIELYDEATSYYWGQVGEGGKIDLYDQAGAYWYGKLKADGNIDLWDQDGAYSMARFGVTVTSTCMIKTASVGGTAD